MVRDMIVQSEEKVSAKLESIETRIEQKLSKLDHVATTPALVYTVAAAVITLLGLMIAILAFAGDRFDGGLGYGTNIGDKVIESRLSMEENARKDAETRARVDTLIDKMDQVLTRLGDDSAKK
jgi:hypothetical protein